MANIQPEAISVISAGVAYGATWIAEKQVFKAGPMQNTPKTYEAAGQAIEASTIQKQSRLGRRVVQPLALLVAASTGFGAYAATQEPTTITQEPSGAVGVVVDHSGATALAFEGNQPANIQINTVAEQFIDKDVKGKAYIASNNQVESAKIKDIPASEPFGNAPLGQAMGTALAETRDGSVVFISNGNEAGKVQDLEESAEANNNKLFVVNVETVDQPKNTLQAEKELAEAMGGEYWKANEDNLDDVASKVKEAVQPASQESGGSDKWPLVLFGGMLIAGTIGTLRQKFRGQLISDVTPKGE